MTKLPRMISGAPRPHHPTLGTYRLFQSAQSAIGAGRKLPRVSNQAVIWISVEARLGG